MNTFDENQIPESQPRQTSYIPEVPKPKKKKAVSAGVVALSLTLALIGGTVGGASTVYFYSQQNTAAPSSASAYTVSETTTQKASSLASTSEKSINSIYETNKSAIVGIRNEGNSTNIFGQTTPFAASGTGFIISSDGYILTNNHVVEGAEQVTVTLFDKSSYPATIIGADPQSDVALLKINAPGLNSVALGNSDNLEVGETIVAIGNPLGELTYTVTAGIVSAEDRDFNENGNSINMFQTDAAINPGNSGGPIFNMDGEVIGISTAKYASEEIEGIGFAIPINDAVNIANQLKESGHVKGRPFLGVSVSDSSILQDSGLPDGAYIASVDPDGAAAKAGIQKGDIITSLDGDTIKSATDLTAVLRGLKAGDTITVTVYRDGKSNTISVILGESKPSV